MRDMSKPWRLGFKVLWRDGDVLRSPWMDGEARTAYDEEWVLPRIACGPLTVFRDWRSALEWIMRTRLPRPLEVWQVWYAPTPVKAAHGPLHAPDPMITPLDELDPGTDLASSLRMGSRLAVLYGQEGHDD